MTDWNKLKVVDLKAELKKRGLPQTGLKPALVARLAAAENGDGFESEATIQDDAPKLDASSANSPDTISPTQPPSDLSAELPAEAPASAPPNSSIPLPDSTGQDAAPVVDAVVPSAEDNQTQTLPTQSPNTVGSSQAPTQNDAHGSALPSVEPQEALDDRQKRKRRSQSPPITAIDASRKRLRQDDAAEDGKNKIMTTDKDATWIENHNAVNPAEINAASEEVAPAGEGVEPGPTIVDIAKDEVKVEDVSIPGATSSTREIDISSKPDTGSSISEALEDSPSRTRDSRFKGLFSTQAPAMEKSRSKDSNEGPEVEPDRIISPAIHPATAALYVRDFMRPLNPSQLQSHLATLATPPGRDVDTSVIVEFYLDPIRTHAFISFTNISAASRVRSALHGRIWPEERTRKPLWVDFIPLEKVREWIEKEESSKAGGRSAAKKWEVAYDTDEDRRVTAYLQETGNAAIRQQPVHLQQPPSSAPTTTAAIPPRVPSGPRADQLSAPKPVTNMKTLGELFNSTETKPLLYWQPVEKSLANKRLDSMDDSTSKRYTRGMAGDINRYTFEDGDVLVDRGPEIFSGIRPPGGHRGGPRGGYRGSSSRGGYQGRGASNGGPGRDYDSYRGGRNGGERRDSRDDRRY